MMNFFSAVPIETAFKFDPNFGAHLAYTLDWLHFMELSSRDSTDDHKQFVKLAVLGFKYGMGHVERYAQRIQTIYRDQHLSPEERAGYAPGNSKDHDC